MSETTKSQIAAAIIKVMQAVKGMEKNSVVGSGNYQYSGTKDADVKEKFNDALAENGLCILPTEIKETTDVNRWEQEEFYNGKSKGIKQKVSVFTKVSTKYILLHESGESVELAGYGHGVDTADKGAGKATTYALKNCLLYTFLTPVGKIDDTDSTHSEDIQQPQADPKDKWLTPNTTDWTNAVDKLQRQAITMDQVQGFYKIRPEHLTELQKAIK